MKKKRRKFTELDFFGFAAKKELLNKQGKNPGKFHFTVIKLSRSASYIFLNQSAFNSS